LLEWFDLNKDKGLVHINAQINDFEGPLQFSPTKHRCHPSVRNRVPTNETSTERPTSTKEKERATKKREPSRKRETPNPKKKVMMMGRV